MKTIEQIKTLVENYERTKKDLATVLKSEISSILSPIFEKYPKLESVGWTQYTPYFCDGDACEFGVNLWNLYINDEWSDDVEDVDLQHAEEEAIAILEEIPEVMYKDMFGDHCKVTIQRNGGMLVEDYEHD